MGIALALLIASWLYPPGYSRDHSHDWFFLFDTHSVMRVDFERLILLDAIIVAVAGAVAWAGARWHLNTAAIGVSVLAAGLVAVTVAIGWQLVEHQLEAAKQAAQQEASRVAAGDLKKVLLFDASLYYHDVQGRIRNDLPRTIEDVELKLSFYNSTGELIEVWRVSPHQDFAPNEPAAFRASWLGESVVFQVSADQKWVLQQGLHWSIEVTNARYSP
jgi:hypothetical protein